MMASNALSVHLRLDIIVRSLGVCKAARKVGLSLPLLVLPLRWLAIPRHGILKHAGCACVCHTVFVVTPGQCRASGSFRCNNMWHHAAVAAVVRRACSACQRWAFLQDTIDTLVPNRRYFVCRIGSAMKCGLSELASICPHSVRLCERIALSCFRDVALC